MHPRPQTVLRDRIADALVEWWPRAWADIANESPDEVACAKAVANAGHILRFVISAYPDAMLDQDSYAMLYVLQEFGEGYVLVARRRDSDEDIRPVLPDRLAIQDGLRRLRAAPPSVLPVQCDPASVKRHRKPGLIPWTFTELERSQLANTVARALEGYKRFLTILGSPRGRELMLERTTETRAEWAEVLLATRRDSVLLRMQADQHGEALSALILLRLLADVRIAASTATDDEALTASPVLDAEFVDEYCRQTGVRVWLGRYAGRSES
jgi:hypothetical protein